jgi:hypothetical protein
VRGSLRMFALLSSPPPPMLLPVNCPLPSGCPSEYVTNIENSGATVVALLIGLLRRLPVPFLGAHDPKLHRKIA